MLNSSFIHVPGIGPKLERYMWLLGARSWDGLPHILNGASIKPTLRKQLDRVLPLSQKALKQGDAGFFSDALPVCDHWRILPEFRDRTIYLDIETTGVAGFQSDLTSVATFDGRKIKAFVAGKNLEEFPDYLARFEFLVTFNGKCFDVPFLKLAFPGLRIPPAHLDLRYFLRSLGYTGGLKGCEKKMGLARTKGLEEADGYLAVLLWQRHVAGDKRALPTLVRYNIDDTVSLQALLERAYNMATKRIGAPFPELELSPPPEINAPYDKSIVQELAWRLRRSKQRRSGAQRRRKPQRQRRPHQ